MVGRPLLILSTMALVLWAATTTQAAEFGTREEAKAMLDKAVTAMKENKEKALAMFNNGESGFKDRDLYVLCANASDGAITASPTSNGKNLKDFAPGQEVMHTATEGQVKEITYWWPRPGSIRPLKKHTFYTKVALGCSDRDDDTVSYAEAANPPEFNWWASYARHIAPILTLTAAISLGTPIAWSAR